MNRQRFPAWCVIALLCGTIVSATSVSATSVRSLSFDELAARAEAIVLVETTSVRSDWRTHAHGKHIVAEVIFKVERTLKGQAGRELQLEFLGGNIGGLVMEVDGMPKFQVGDRDVLFLSTNRKSVSPVVGLFQGRFRVERDRATGTDRVLMYNGKPFVPASAGVARLLSAPMASLVRPLTYSQFESLVAQTLGQAR